MATHLIPTSNDLVLAQEWTTAALERHTNAGEAAQTLHALHMAQQALAGATIDAVSNARAQGETWEQIGEALGVTRQAAWELYNRGA